MKCIFRIRKKTMRNLTEEAVKVWQEYLRGSFQARLNNARAVEVLAVKPLPHSFPLAGGRSKRATCQSVGGAGFASYVIIKLSCSALEDLLTSAFALWQGGQIVCDLLPKAAIKAEHEEHTRTKSTLCETLARFDKRFCLGGWWACLWAALKGLALGFLRSCQTPRVNILSGSWHKTLIRKWFSQQDRKENALIP